MAITTAGTTTGTNYLDTRIAAAVEAQQQAEAAEAARQEAERQKRCADELQSFRAEFEATFDDAELLLALGVRFEAHDDYHGVPYAHATFEIDGGELRVVRNGHVYFRLIDPTGESFSTSLITEIHVQSPTRTNELLLGIAKYRERVAALAEQRAERARLEQEEREERARLAADTTSASAPATPEARIITDLTYSRTIGLSLDAYQAKVAELDCHGSVTLIEMTPHQGEYGEANPSTPRLRLTAEEMRLLIAAYCAYQAEQAIQQADTDAVPF